MREDRKGGGDILADHLFYLVFHSKDEILEAHIRALDGEEGGDVNDDQKGCPNGGHPYRDACHDLIQFVEKNAETDKK